VVKNSKTLKFRLWLTQKKCYQPHDPPKKLIDPVYFAGCLIPILRSAAVVEKIAGKTPLLTADCGCAVRFMPSLVGLL
jgi:hypothetical protein